MLVVYLSPHRWHCPQEGLQEGFQEGAKTDINTPTIKIKTIQTANFDSIWMPNDLNLIATYIYTPHKHIYDH